MNTCIKCGEIILPEKGCECAAKRASGSLQPDCSAAGLVARINEYLQLGGLFNPEMMEHDKVRDLLMDCREALAQQPNDQAQPQRDYDKRS